MRRITILAVSALTLLFAAGQSSESQAGSGWEMQLLLPEVYVPRFNGERYYDDEDDDEYVAPRRRGRMVYDENIDEWVPRSMYRKHYYYDEDLDEWVPRKRKRAAMVYDENLDDWVPVYEPPRKAKKNKKKVKTAKAAKPAKEARSAEARPVKRKTQEKQVAKAKSSVTDEIQTASLSQPVTKPAPKKTSQTASVTAKSAPKTSLQTASKPAAGQKIGCTNGADIITGYGFSAVKPRGCSGATYTFDALRADKAYVISLSSSTGEITDVKKVN